MCGIAMVIAAVAGGILMLLSADWIAARRRRARDETRQGRAAQRHDDSR